MTRYFISGFLLICSFSLSAQDSNDIVGEWLTKNSEAQVTIYKEQRKYVGKITRVKDSKQSSLLDTIILSDFIFDAKEREWTNGTVFEPRHGHKSSGYLILKDANTLKVTGYKGFRWISDSETWTRIDTNTK